MDIKYARRILFLGAREAGALDVVKDLTGSAPSPDVDGSTAGLTHEWDVETPYYCAKIPIWIDEVADLQAWKDEFLKDEAQEVVEAVGAWIFCFQKEQDGGISNEVEQTLRSIQEVIEHHSSGAEAAMLAVAKRGGKQSQQEEPHQEREELEDKCMEYGFEYIDYAARGKNEFGEKVGFERLREALEANEWASASAEDENAFGIDDPDHDIDHDTIGSFDQEEAEMTAELFSMKAALTAQDEARSEEDFMVPPPQQTQRQAGQVEDLDRLMGKLLAIKEQGADLSSEQRKRMAAKAVNELMRENPNI
ncbi:Hypothetical predicted protein [Lecanosticta acicola]|uniref:Increased recombination centers protein 6 n=1 Tax=Lecanosticta acicola TaxID=111012 RepID=A0AAI8YXC3_9PEZI|nr:Hypothetical predicted protein [Lecanosticta acicola]